MCQLLSFVCYENGSIKTPFCLRKDYREAATGILLIVAVLVLGTTACDGAHMYQLTIFSASGGNVTAPGEGSFTYDAGSLIQLLAAPDDGYQFLSWTGNIQHLANPGAASTTITMNGNYAIVANFEIESETDPSNGGAHEQ
jgi:hypothetical protein